MKLTDRRIAATTPALLTIVLVSVFAACQLVAAQEASVYKWVDKQGTTHYTDIPPAEGHAERIAMSYKRTNNSAVRSRLARRAEASEVAKLRESQQAEDAAAEKAKRASIAKQRSANCEQARKTLQKYTEAHILYKPGADGEREYLSNAEIDEARMAARQSVKEWCDE